MMICKKKVKNSLIAGLSRVSLLLLITIRLTSGNDPATDYKHYRSKYPDDVTIKLRNDRFVEIKLRKGKPEIRMTDYDENMYLQLTPYSGTDEKVYFSNLNPLKELNAYSLIPENSSYQKIRIQRFDTIDYRSPNVFHDDDKALKFNFMGLKSGSKTILETTHQLLEPYLISPFFFNNFISTESAMLQVSFPENMKMGYKIFNDKGLNIKMTESRKGSTITYTWQATDLPRLKSEEDDPGSLYYMAHIFVYIREFTDNDGNIVKMADNMDYMYQWYYSTISHPPMIKPGSELSRLVDSLTRNCSDTLEMIRNIDYWVQDNISYIAFESGIDAYKPNPAATVLSHRYGDCKGMANLLYNMLKIKGIRAYPTWIGTRDLPYSYRDLMHPNCSDHMIVTVKACGRTLFLDATMRPRPFDLASSAIQDKEALLGIDSTHYEILKVPVTPSQKNLLSDSVRLVVQNGQITGTGTMQVGGYLRHDLAGTLVEKTADKQKEYLSRYLQKGNNKFEVNKFDVQNLSNRDKDIIINYDFDLHEYMTKVGDEMFININLVRIKEDKLLEEDRKLQYSKRFGWVIRETVALEIPEGYEVKSLPPLDGVEGENFGFQAEYSRTGNTIVLHFLYHDDFLVLDQQHFGEWNSMIKKLRAAYAETITLSKK